MSDYLPKRTMRKNAQRIDQLAKSFGHLAVNQHGQTVEQLNNLSIPCASLIVFELVTQVVDSYDTVNDQAVQNVERYCAEAVSYAEGLYGPGWYTDLARQLELPKWNEVTA